MMNPDEKLYNTQPRCYAHRFELFKIVHCVISQSQRLWFVDYIYTYLLYHSFRIARYAGISAGLVHVCTVELLDQPRKEYRALALQLNGKFLMEVDKKNRTEVAGLPLNSLGWKMILPFVFETYNISSF